MENSSNVRVTLNLGTSVSTVDLSRGKHSLKILRGRIARRKARPTAFKMASAFEPEIFHS